MSQDEFTKLFHYMQKLEKRIGDGFENTATKQDIDQILNILDAHTAILDTH